METILTYLLKVSIATAFFFVTYYMFFRKDTFLTFKRIYLTSSLILSMLIPFISIHFSNSEATKIPTAWLSEVVITPFGITQHEKAQTIDWQSLIMVGLSFASAIFLLHFGIQVIGICRLKYENLSRKRQDCVLINLKENNVSSFSFFKWIFVSNSIWSSENCDEILRHELVHARQWHSADVVFAELFCALFWWNPISWLFRREIRINHEFLADRGVLRQGFNTKSYQYLLLNTLTVTNRIPINNHFNILQLKKRIAMMNKKESNKLSAAKYLLALPVVALLVIGNASCQRDKKDTSINEETKTDKTIKASVNDKDSSKVQLIDKNGKKINVQVTEVTDSDKPFVGVEQMPRFPGGETELMQYLSKNIRYPKDAAENGIQGRVILRYIVGKTGKIRDVVVLKGLSPTCDAEAIRVVKAMPDWTPGRQNGKAVSVYYTLPISYRLQ